MKKNALKEITTESIMGKSGITIIEWRVDVSDIVSEKNKLKTTAVMFDKKADSTPDGRKMLIWEPIVAMMLLDGTLLIYPTVEDSLGVGVNMNDVFYPAADIEIVKDLKDLIELYEAYRQDRTFGPIYWVCKKRNLEPWTHIYSQMVKLGYNFEGMTPGLKEY